MPNPVLSAPKQVFKGHYSSSAHHSLTITHNLSDTIKSVNFYGPDSEFIMSGSDDTRIYIWEKKTGKLLRLLEVDCSSLNVLIRFSGAQ